MGGFWKGPWPSDIETHKLLIDISVEGEEEYITLNTDESYTLTTATSAGETRATINAKTFFGARHALETLSQLIDFDEENNSMQVVSTASIEDSPAFSYRGIIVDTARNYMGLDELKNTLDAMSYNKLNTFHWHITDSNSFPLVINSLPDMTNFGAYSPSEIYSPSDVRDIVQYARVRGIRVLPEIDAPAHAGHGWQWGEEQGLGKLVLCLDAQPSSAYCVQPPCGQMNLANEKLYDVLGTVYNDVIDMFSPVDLFHYGGDEVHLSCWNTSTEMTDWMIANNFGLEDSSYYKQWGVFQEKARNLITKANKGKEIKGVIWTSHLTEKGRADVYLNQTKYVIQIWTLGNDPIIKELLEKGFDIIMSNRDAMYLDCGVSSWNTKGPNWCSPYKGWQDLYDNDLHQIARNLVGSDKHAKQILGGEAALWSEQADSQTIDLKVNG
ncbi:UNVERIFIED_CONTAM: hypothetical protein GTU68_059838 [Idotea baltica]|nr:hypothetical protein [Idotea baltica]